MSAWKKPSRSAWRRKVWITERPSCGRSKPLASSVARSLSGVASIHSSVSTSRAVRSQSTAGTRKSGSSLVFSASSDSAAASSRRSISSRTERAQDIHHLDQPQPPRLRTTSLRPCARRNRKRRDRPGSAARCPGRSTFTATARGPPSRHHFGAMHLRDGGRRHRRAERW